MIREYQHNDWPEVEVLYGKMLEELYTGDVARYPRALLFGLFYPLRSKHVEFGMVAVAKTGCIEGFIVGYRDGESIFRISNIYIEPCLRGTSTSFLMYNLLAKKVKAKFGSKFLVAGVSSRQKDIKGLLDGLGFEDFEIYMFKELK